MTRSLSSETPSGDGGSDSDTGGVTAEMASTSPELVSRVPAASLLSSANFSKGSFHMPASTSRGTRSEDCATGRADTIKENRFAAHDYRQQMPHILSSTDRGGPQPLTPRRQSCLPCSGGDGGEPCQARDKVSTSVPTPGLGLISSPTSTTSIPEEAGERPSVIPTFGPMGRQLGGTTVWASAVNGCVAAAPTAASACTWGPSCFSAHGNGIHIPLHRPQQICSVLTVDAMEPTDSRTPVLSHTVRKPTAPPPVHGPAVACRERTSDGVDVTLGDCVEAEVASTLRETHAPASVQKHLPTDKNQSMGAAALDNEAAREGLGEGPTILVTSSAARAAQGEGDSGGSAERLRIRAGNDQRKHPVTDDMKDVPQLNEDVCCAFTTEAPVKHLPFSMCEESGTSIAPGLDLLSVKNGLLRGLVSSSSLQQRSSCPAEKTDCTVRGARSGDGSLGSHSNPIALKQIMEDPPCSHCRHVAQSRGRNFEDLMILPLTSLVTVPPTVQTLLLNSDTTKEELWMALRDLCQRLEVLECRLARGEISLGNEKGRYEKVGGGNSSAANNTSSEYRRGDVWKNPTTPSPRSDLEKKTDRTAGDDCTGTGVHNARSDLAKVQVDPAHSCSSASFQTPVPTRNKLNSSHSQMKRTGEWATAPSSTAETGIAHISVDAHPHANPRATLLSPSQRDCSKSSSVSWELRSRVVEVIRSVERERKAPAISVAVLQPHEGGAGRPICGLNDPRYPRALGDGTRESSSNLWGSSILAPSADMPGILASAPSLSVHTGGMRYARTVSDSPVSAASAVGRTACGPAHPPRTVGEAESCGAACDAVSPRASRGQSDGSVGDDARVVGTGFYVASALPVISAGEVHTPLPWSTRDPGCDGEGTSSAAGVQRSLSLPAFPECAPVAVGEGDFFNFVADVASTSWGCDAVQATTGSTASESYLNHISLNTRSLTPSSAGQHPSGSSIHRRAYDTSAAVISSRVVPRGNIVSAVHAPTSSPRQTAREGPCDRGGNTSPNKQPASQQQQVQEQEQHQHPPTTRTHAYGDDAAQLAQVTVRLQSLLPVQPDGPGSAVHSTASQTLQWLRQLQQEGSAVSLVTETDERIALRQWRSEAALVKAKGTRTMY